MFEFGDNHPVLGTAMLFVGLGIYMWIKYLIDSRRGINSKAYYRVMEILKKVIPTVEEYVPVYAYWVENSRWLGKYYAVGITDDKLYVVPLHISKKEIDYSESFVIMKSSLGKINSGNTGCSIRNVYLYDRKQQEIIRFDVDEKNTRMDKAYPLNLTQTEEFHAFFAKLDSWKKEIEGVL